MAEPLPAALKIPEVSRFINRANQLRTFKPAIAYWCEYHAVNQIVAKGLHNGDDEAFEFTKGLIERLETTKAERADDDAIVDNTAGQAYVEQFAQETFARAERTMRANKVTRQTADTFDAAATFFDLTREWGEPEPDVLQRIKFSKWNAARILKAIREGKDPNESNPQPRENDEEAQLDAEADALAAELTQQQQKPKPAAVEDAADLGEPSAPGGSSAAAASSVHEGYFPPGPPAAQTPPVQAAPPPMEGLPSAGSQIPPQPSPQIPTKITPGLDPHIPSAVSPPPPSNFPSAPPPPSQPAFHSGPPPPSAPSPAAAYPPPVLRPMHAAPPPAPAPVPQPVVTANVKDINQAQKHAKFAISALNFDDVPTAINELRTALAMLGAQ